MESGHISIHAENILPIIKRWLYSEKEIFLRELVANATDAVLKLQKLALVGEVLCDLPEARIDLAIDKAAGTLTITDTGLGMTEDEIKRYINQVAFSGVSDFLEKYKDKKFNYAFSRIYFKKCTAKVDEQLLQGFERFITDTISKNVPHNNFELVLKCLQVLGIVSSTVSTSKLEIG